jgi:FtsP/CotA-like multicopper oxidase with cupredoxin domain
MCSNIFSYHTHTRTRAALTVAALAAFTFAAFPSDSGAATGPEAVTPNDNTRRAGSTSGATVTIRLRAAEGVWRPEGDGGLALTVEAFGEEGGALTVPAPLVRVTEGTTVVVSVRNDLTTPLRVHGLCTRNRERCAPLEVGAGARREVRFESGPPGTYHYWATSLGSPFPFRELGGALVVDSAAAPPEPDRIFVITEWMKLTPSGLAELLAADDVNAKFVELDPRYAFVINGLSWPATERLTYTRGDAVRWRVINLSSQVHPMHLHGFYFTVRRTGNGWRDDAVAGGSGRRVVTEVLPSGGTALMEWTPEREGNWLFHCHVMSHVTPARRLAHEETPRRGHHGAAHDAALGMAGMVLGLTVLPAPGDASVDETSTPPARRVAMTIAPGASGAIAIRFAEAGPDTAVTQPQWPGPTLVLRRGEPVEIAVENRLAEATSIHWHGLELDSYYDGAHGWSGIGTRTAPMIEPGRTFVVRLTPPRAGTFIYHTHLHDYRQLTAGLYGALVVTDADEGFDPTLDHVILLGRRDATEASSILQDASTLVINGERSPRWRWAAARRHRVRVINITPDDVLAVALLRGETPVTWRRAGKDGAALTGDDGEAPASVRIAVGETYDFELDVPPGRGRLWLDVRTTSGKWQAQGEIVVR